MVTVIEMNKDGDYQAQVWVPPEELPTSQADWWRWCMPAFKHLDGRGGGTFVVIGPRFRYDQACGDRTDS